MKLTLERKPLVAALGAISRTIERRNTIPVLGNVHLKATGKTLSLRGTDLDIELTVTVPADIDKAGETTVSASLLHDTMRKVDAEHVTFDANDTHIAVKAGRSRFKLQTLPASDFPDLQAGDLTGMFDLSGADLTSLFKRVQTAISVDQHRYYLNGVFVHCVGKKLHGVATDGHRMGVSSIDVPKGAEEISAIVPRKSVDMILRQFGAEETVRVHYNKQKILIEGETCSMLTKQIDGSFPEYDRVMPKDNKIRATLGLGDLRSAVDRVGTISSNAGRAAKFSFTDNKLDLEMNNPDMGSANEQVDCALDGAPVEIGFNYRYMLDLLGNFSGENIELNLADAGSPTLFFDPADKSLRYVLMPMRVN